jgi:hypothetical protein
MNDHIQSAKTYILENKKELIIGTVVIVAFVALVTAIALSVYNSIPKVVYQPASACDLLTPAEAKELLGAKTLQSDAKPPVLSGDTGTSRCGYADGNPDKDSMIIAAIMVRSGINDKGVQQNKTEFAAGKPSENVEDVKDLGDSAYFNQKLGQLNVLNGREWIILSYGVGATPEANTVEQVVELAHKVVR